MAEDLAVRARVGRLPGAVVTVDLYGQCADYDRLTALCAEYEVPLVADAAEALGATYRGRPAGSFGAAAVFSFNGNKIITTGGGGMLVSEAAELVDRARFLATQAREPVRALRARGHRLQLPAQQSAGRPGPGPTPRDSTVGSSDDSASTRSIGRA